MQRHVKKEDYTLDEIDSLRAAIARRIIMRRSHPVLRNDGTIGGWNSDVFGGGELEEEIELQLRTYIILGILADEVDKETDRYVEKQEGLLLSRRDRAGAD